MPELADEVAEARFVADRACRVVRCAPRPTAGRCSYDPREALERISAEVRREVTA
jgi:hypothetical protein